MTNFIPWIKIKYMFPFTNTNNLLVCIFKYIYIKVSAILVLNLQQNDQSNKRFKSKNLQSSGMIIDFNNDVQIILTSLQLFLYAAIASVAVYKITLSKKHHAKFLLIFYLFALLDILVYGAMLIYQIVKLTFDQEIHLVVLVIINVYSMIVEGILLFLLSFYWKETEAMLRGSGLQSQQSVSHVKRQMKFKAVILIIWSVIYTTFLIYSLVKNQYVDDNIYVNIFYFGGQGISTLLLVWSNLSQAISAKNFAFTLKKYQVLVSYSMNKRKFRCIYWVATTINFLRLFYLIVATVLFRIYTETDDIEWLAMFIYSASALIPLSIYLYSFQINQKNKNQSLQSFSVEDEKSQKDIKGLYQPPQISSPQRVKSKRARESFNQTELSSSYDSHGI